MKKIYLFQLLALGSFAFNSYAMDLEREKLKVEKAKVKALQQIALAFQSFSDRYANRTQVELLKNTNVYSSDQLYRFGRAAIEEISKTEKEIEELKKQFAASSASEEPVTVDDLLLLPKEQ